MLKIHTLSNGLRLVIEEMPHLESAAWQLLIPGGHVQDSDSRCGTALILSELLSRGAGAYDSHGLSDAFDRLGIRHGEHADSDRYSLGASLLAENLEPGFELLSAMVLKPLLPEKEIDSLKSLALQDLKGLMDNPSRRVMEELSARYFPAPWNRSSHGTKEGIESLTHRDLVTAWETNFKPKDAILSVAGKVCEKQVLELTEKYLGAWKGQGAARPGFGAVSRGGSHFVKDSSSQTQIALLYPSERFLGRHYYAAKVAASVLSGGMFGRLFTEVREKRGLVYSVYARHSCNAEHGEMLLYAGTTPERAEETLSVSLNELRRLPGTLETEELERSRTNLVASLVIGQETSSARAGSNGMELWLSGKGVRSIEEIQTGIESVTANDIEACLAAFPSSSPTLVTLGQNGLEVK